MRRIVLFLVLSVLMLSCEKEIELEQLIIADHKVSCTGIGPQECLLVKRNVSDEWQFFYGGIEGFDYEEGFEYIIEVKVYDVENPPVDGSSKRYVLNRIISKQ